MARVYRMIAGRNGRSKRRFDAETLQMAELRQVTGGQLATPHYDPASPHYGGRDLHESGKIELPWDRSRPHVEGSALVAPPLHGAVVPAEHYLLNARRQWRSVGIGGGSAARNKRVGHVEDWEAAVFRMMRQGPGFVGTAATMYGEWMAGSGRLIVQERRGTSAVEHDEWVDSEYEPALEILRMWRGEHATQADLIREAMKYLDSVGQFYQAMRKLPDGSWAYDLWAHSAVTLNQDTGRIEDRGVEHAYPDDELWFCEYPASLVDHLFLADHEWKGKPTSQMQRVIGDIYRLILASRTMDRDLMSRLAQNGIIWIPSSPGGRDWTGDLAEWASAAFTGTFDPDYMPGVTGSLEEVAPFPLQTVGEPKFVDVGRDVSRAREVYDLAWEAICLGLDMPKNAMDGNEAANRWTGFLNRDEESLKAAAPRMQRLAAMVEQTHFRPWAKILRIGRDPSNFRVWYQLPDVRPERTNEKINVARTLVPTRAALAETVGWSTGDLADLPEGMSDFEAMFLMTHGKPLEQAWGEAAQAEAKAEGLNKDLEAADQAFEDAYNQTIASGGQPPADAPQPGSDSSTGSPLGDGMNEPTQPAMPGDGAPLAASLQVPSGLGPFVGELGSWEELVPR